MDGLESLKDAINVLMKNGQLLEAVNLQGNMINMASEILQDEELLRKTVTDVCIMMNDAAMKELKNGSSTILPLDILSKAEAILHRFPANPNILVTTYSNLANTHRSQGNLDAAIRFAEKSLLISKNVVGENLDGDSVSCAHLTMCCILSQMENHEEALEHAQLAVSQCLEYLLPIRKTKCLSGLGYGEQILTLCIAYHNVGVQFEFLKNSNAAIPWYQRAVDTCIKYLPQKVDVIMAFSKSLQQGETAMTKEVKSKVVNNNRKLKNSTSSTMKKKNIGVLRTYGNNIKASNDVSQYSNLKAIQHSNKMKSKPAENYGGVREVCNNILMQRHNMLKVIDKHISISASNDSKVYSQINDLRVPIRLLSMPPDKRRKYNKSFPNNEIFLLSNNDALRRPVSAPLHRRNQTGIGERSINKEYFKHSHCDDPKHHTKIAIKRPSSASLIGYK